jgi:hypothetical protein
MGKSKSKPQRPDDYARYGPIEIARFGKLVVMRNNMTEDEKNKILNDLAEEYPIIKNNIDELVEDIRNLVIQYDPLELLRYSYYNMFFSMLGKPSESQYDFDDIVAVRMIDYIQSVIVSTKRKDNKYKNIDIEDWSNIYDKVSELYRNLSYYHICHSAYLEKNDPNFDKKYDSLYVQAQELRTNVRGQRYPVHEIPHHSDLFYPHDDVFKELFNIGVKEFLQGIEKLQFSLMRGLGRVVDDFETLMEKTAPFLYQQIENEEQKNPLEEMDKILVGMGLTELRDSIIGGFFGYDLFDVEKVTGFPRKLLKNLSWEIGENESFFSDGEYAGWPLRRLPIEERPFICINEKFYCFDLYSLFDNLYRVMQRLILRLKPEYKDDWNKKQKEVSEQLPLNLLKKILSGGISYHSIEYISRTGKNKKKQWCECDGIFIYDDHLIVIEVKAGSFTYTHPSTDFKAFIKSIEGLAKNPHEQASRFIDTLKVEGKITIYNKERKPLKELNYNDFRQITPCSITIDNFNEFAARLDKLSPLGIELNEYPSWNISIDELRVYADYFDSPSKFLHFLEQRLKAAKSKNLELNDELDHLGLYIAHNLYTNIAELSDSSPIHWHGYREDLDIYFSGKTFPEIGKLNKPEQEIPERIEEIIEILDKQRKSGFTKVASTILNLSFDSRISINSMMKTMMERQLESKKVMPLSIFGEDKITFICNHDGIPRFQYKDAKEYVLATMLKPNEDIRLALYLDYDIYGKLYNVDFEFLSIKDIPSERMSDFRELSEKLAKQRLFSYMKQTGVKKIGRNELCPCGSGKKYKRCCGK